MGDFGSDSCRSNHHHPSRPERRPHTSDENDPANSRSGFWINSTKPSGSWKTTSPEKKVLGERNGSEDVDGSVRTLKLRQSLFEVSESKEDVSSLSPCGPFKNNLLPRPKFLRYRPDWRSEVMTRKRDEEDEKEIGRMNDLGQSFSEEEEYSDEESEEEEEEEENVEGSYSMKGLIKKLAWFVLFLFSASYVYHVDVGEGPSEVFNSYEDGLSSWPINNFTYSEKIVGVDSLYDEHCVLSSQSERDDVNEVTLDKIEEEMLQNFWYGHRSAESEELSQLVIRNSHFVDDDQDNAAEVDGEDEVRQKSEGGDELSEFEKLHSPTAVSSQFMLVEIINEKFTSSEEYPTQAEFETPKAQDLKIASVRGMTVLSLSIPFLIASSLFLGMFLMRLRSSPNIVRSETTKKLFESQPVVHSSYNAEQQLPEEYQSVPRRSAEAPSAVYHKDDENASLRHSLRHSLAPGVELLGEFTFGGSGNSHESNTVTKLQKTAARQSIDFMSMEKSVLEVSPESPFIKSPSPGSSTFRKTEIDNGTNGSTRATPTTLRRSSRLRNQAIQ